MKICVNCNSILVRKRRSRGRLESLAEFKRRISCGNKCNPTKFKKGNIMVIDSNLRPRGEKHYNWKGGISFTNENFRKTKRYKDWRLTILIRDNYTCQLCSIRGGALQVDHIKPFAYYPELRLDSNNARTLCIKCHRSTPTYGEKAKQYV